MLSRCLSFFSFYFLFSFIFFVSITVKAENYLKINYGISTHDMDTVTHAASGSTITHDDEDEGFIISGGTMLGDNWGLDVMYYDLGSSSLTSLDVGDDLKIENDYYRVNTAGTISNDITGFGTGIILTTDTDNESSINVNAYFKAGVHAWDKSGSTTLLDRNSDFAGRFFDKGIGAYSGLGAGIDVSDNISIELAYDIIGLSKNASFADASSLISVGIKIRN